MSRKEIEKNPYGNLIFNMGVLYIFYFQIGINGVNILQSTIIHIYFLFDSCCFVANVNEIQSKAFLCIYYICVSCFFECNQMRSVYMVPYTNYFFLLGRKFVF